MTKLFKSADHPDLVFVLSSPDLNHDGTHDTHLYLTLREACWGVIEGHGNGSVYSYERGQQFGHLTALTHTGVVDLTQLSASAYCDWVLAAEEAGLDREYSYVDGERRSDWRIYGGADGKLYSKTRKAAHTALQAALRAELNRAGVLS